MSEFHSKISSFISNSQQSRDIVLQLLSPNTQRPTLDGNKLYSILNNNNNGNMIQHLHTYRHRAKSEITALHQNPQKIETHLVVCRIIIHFASTKFSAEKCKREHNMMPFVSFSPSHSCCLLGFCYCCCC